MDNKTIVTMISSFNYIGILLIACAFILFLQSLLSDGGFEIGVLIPLIVGAVFCYVGLLGRKFSFLEQEIKYSTTKLVFQARYDEINLLQTFHDKQTNSDNFLIFVDEDKILSLSSNFYQEDKLKEIYNELILRCSEYIEKNELTIEDELNWQHEL